MGQKVKIIIAEFKENKGWINLKDNKGVEYSIMISKSPVIGAFVQAAKPGDELEADLAVKDNKNYLWDIKAESAGGGKKFSGAPKDKNWESAIAAAQATGQILFSKGFDPAAFDNTFEHIFNKITSKITKQQENNQ